MPSSSSSSETDVDALRGDPSCQRFEMYGLRIRSEIPLGEVASPFSESPDLVIRLSEEAAFIDAAPEGELLASLELGDGRGYVFVRGRKEYSLAFHGVCEFRFSQDLRIATVRLAPGQSVDMAGWLLRASVPALLLGLAGECTLHASAIESDGAALVFPGESGMGKSTLAARFCAAGHRLVTDDLLRLNIAEDSISCFPGGGEIRIRDGASELSGLFTSDRVGQAVDGRLTLRCDRISAPLPLAALAIPRPAREHSRIAVRRLAKAEALYCLSAWPRVLGWKIAEPRRAHFQNLGELVKKAPVFEVEMPWGPPFPDDFVPEILRLVRDAGD
ncbi:MAG: hypothetical protein ACI8QF_004792 [Limisphaerales bacterium]|jgi:hypothetical protein